MIKNEHDTNQEQRDPDKNLTESQGLEPRDLYTGAQRKTRKAEWVPYAVLGTLVLFGILGIFFGAFSKSFAFTAAEPKGGEEATAPTQTTPTMPKAPAPKATAKAPAPPTELTADLNLRQLVVVYKGASRAQESVTRSKDEAKARATEAMQKGKSGVNFDELVKAYSDESGGGQIIHIPKDGGGSAKGVAFYAPLEKLKVGELSDVMETPFGFHVFQRAQ
jgi:hypothetical protein